MNTLRNKVQLIGHLGADPEVKNMQNGAKIANLRIATTERYLSNGAWKEDTQWHNLTMWDKLAERAENNLHKGSFVLVDGKLMHRTYVDAQGQTKYFTDIRVANLIILDKKSGVTDPALHAVPADDVVAEEDLPF